MKKENYTPGHSKPAPYTIIQPDELHWRPSNLMQIPNADFLERTGTKAMGVRLWRLSPKSANTLHKHVSSEEFYFVLEGTGRIRIGEETLTIKKHGGVHVMPEQLRQIFNDSDEEVLWLIVGAPDDEQLPGQGGKVEDFYPVDPKQLPPALKGIEWPHQP